MVPSERRTLAKAKRTGEVRAYLDEIADGDESRAAERWFYTDWLNQSWCAPPVLRVCVLPVLSPLARCG